MDATMDGDSFSRSSNEDYYYNYYCCDPADLHYSYSDDSSMSTPSKKGAAGVHNRTRPNMDSALKTDLSNLVVRDVDVEEYVQYVYGVSKNDISYIKSKKWELKGLSTYTEMLDKGANEDALYEPFKNIMGDIFETLAKDGRKIDIHHASLGTKELKGTANVCKPDQLFFFGSHTDEMPVTWSLSKAFVEFTVTPKAHSLKAAILGQKFSTIKEEVAVAVGSAAPDAPAGSPTIFSSPDIATPPTIFSTPDLSALPTIPSTPPRTKRHSTGDANERPAKRPKLGPLTGKAPQAAGYALEAQDNANQLRLAQSEGKNAVENPTTVEEPATQRAAIAKRRRARRQSNNSKASAPPLLAAATSIPDHAPRDDLDFETLGGCLTFENFMAALNGSEPVGIPEEYEEYANTLLREPKQVDASGST
ncbi:hypothetical protein EYR36_010425 [Pleurotus pulmonarius]|nr:hypothetical protein EYR36_010425 [Pleurotus pulmonarius]